MKKIAFFDAKQYDEESFNKIKNEYDYKFKFFDTNLNEDTAYLAKGYDAVCIFVNDIVNEKVIEELHEIGIRLIALRCAGYNNIDFKAAFNKIHIVRVPAYSPYAIAEHAFSLITTLNRRTHKAYNRTRESNFNISGLMGFDLYQKTIGIVGMGKIGTIVSDIAKGYGMNVLAYDMFKRELDGVKFVELDEIYEKSDVISLHCPLTQETHHLINKDTINKMKQGVMLINTSRGGLINTEDLIDGIKSKKIGYAGLDVYEEEANYFFEDFSDEIIDDDVLARLLTFNNVLVTSHQAFLTREALNNIARTTLDNINDFINDKPLKNEICYQCDKVNICDKTHEKKCF